MSLLQRGSGFAAVNPLGYLQDYIKAQRPGGLNVAWYDPADKSTLFQDQAGTIPVTSSGQLVGLMLDKFNNLHMTFDAGKEPVYVESGAYAYLDGTARTCAGYSPIVNLTAYAKAVVSTGINKLSDATSARVFEFGTNPTTQAGALSLSAPSVNGFTNFSWSARGLTTTSSVTVGAQASPKLGVITGEADLLNNLVNVRFNGIDRSNSATDMGGGALANQRMHLFSRNNGASLPFLGHFYGLIFRAGDTPVHLRNSYEAYQSIRTGVF